MAPQLGAFSVAAPTFRAGAGNVRRQETLQQVSQVAKAALLTVGALAASPLAVHAASLHAVETKLTGDNERAISYRHQQHVGQTSDGGFTCCSIVAAWRQRQD